MTTRERLARDLLYKGELCHEAWRALILAQDASEPVKSERIAALWASFRVTRRDLENAYNRLSTECPKNPLPPIELYYV